MTRRLIAADVLKLVRRRGQMIWGLILTLAPIVVAYAVTAGYHLSDAAKFDAAGGARNLENALWLILMLGGVAAAVLGTSAGIGDESAGVFRELVVTGRSRLALFASRAPAALLVFLPMVLVAFAVAVVCTFVLADGLPTPSAATIAMDAAWVLAIASVQLLFGDRVRGGRRLARHGGRRAGRVAAGGIAASALDRPAGRRPRARPAGGGATAPAGGRPGARVRHVRRGRGRGPRPVDGRAARRRRAHGRCGSTRS